MRSGDPGKRTRLMHCHDVQFYSAAFTSLLVDPRFTRVAQGIVGPNVQLHHTKMFIKPPENGSPFPMHQDYPYFPHKRHSMIAAIIHFDDAPVEKGCLRVVPGSHKLGPLEAVGQDHHLPEDRFPIDGALPIPAKAGDAIFMSYLLVHGSGVNQLERAAHHDPRADARPRGRAAQRQALLARPGHDAGGHRSASARSRVRLGAQS